jgi:hypothetical protein
MSDAELDNPAFQDDDLAREWFEARIWPDARNARIAAPSAKA